MTRHKNIKANTFFVFAPLTSSPPTGRNKNLKADTLGRLEEWNGGGVEQRDADELASELRGKPRRAAGPTWPRPLWLLCSYADIFATIWKKKKVDPHKLDPWDKGADRHCTLPLPRQRYCRRERGRREELCMQFVAAAPHELATRDQTFPWRLSPAQRVVSLTTWIKTIPTWSLVTTIVTWWSSCWALVLDRWYRYQVSVGIESILVWSFSAVFGTLPKLHCSSLKEINSFFSGSEWSLTWLYLARLH